MKRRKELGAKTHVGRFKIYLLSNCLSSAWRVLGTPLSRGDGTGSKTGQSLPSENSHSREGTQATCDPIHDVSDVEF